MNATNRNSLLVVLLFVLTQTFGQTTPGLERVITISFANEKIESALNRIGSEAKVTFSYNAELLEDVSPVTLSFKTKTVREVIERIFKGAVSYKEIGGYIVLTKATKVSSQFPTEKPTTSIFGYILNAINGERVSNASIRDAQTLASVTSNEFGYFALDLSSMLSEYSLAITAKNFRDTSYLISASNAGFVTLKVMPVPQTLELKTASEATGFADQSMGTQSDTLSNNKTNESQLTETYQEGDTIYRIGQASLLPYLGTNGRYSDVTINGYSFNLLGGTALATQYAEFGGLFNINRDYVNGFQAAGLFNSDGGFVSGVQVAGLYNTSKGITGAQLAGGVNINGDSLKGTQLAGGVNINNGSGLGTQAAGGININTGDVIGAQVAGLANISTKRLVGAQVSGLVNYGKNVRGLQLGLINIADSLHGVPIGIFSYVRHGYHKVELFADEIFYTNIAFRTGTHHFYNIMTFGMKPENDPGDNNVEWTFGYGIGTAPRLTRWLYLNFDLTSNHLSKGKISDGTNLLNKLFMGFEFQVQKKCSIALGVTLNGYITDLPATGYKDIFTGNRPRIIQEHTNSNGTDFMMWWGLKGAIRFF